MPMMLRQRRAILSDAFSTGKRLLAGLALCGLLGCSPGLNWRTVTPADSMLEVLLPCKPETVKRPVDWAGKDVVLVVTGCKAGAFLFAVSYMDLMDERQVAPVLMQWQESVRASVGTQVTTSSTRFVPAHARDIPLSVRLSLQGMGTDGQPVHAQAVWFVRQGDAARIRVYHALVFGSPVDSEAADTMLGSLRLLP
ncbi:hypothetical protein [Comamonas badia]|uniref:hypothetical protein n=1 Tax=Comamonas badia TaxID=265291 RepID=UPI0012EB1C43|nr:hypothetical protein [Comamonas badia]